MSANHGEEAPVMNTQLVESLVLIIQSLNPEERRLLEDKLFFVTSEPSTKELQQLAQNSGSFDFLDLELGR